MQVSPKTLLAVVILLAIVTALLRFKPWRSGMLTEEKGKRAQQTLAVGYLPVTCHLTCPVTDFASKTTVTGTKFNSKVFSDFPTVVSALQAKQVLATFMLVPLALKLREQGVPIKICYLGHRDGSEIIVPKASNYKTLRDLKGKTLAIPSLYSNQYLVACKLMADQGLKAGDIKFVMLPPPDMPTSLAAGAIDGYFVGEPFCARAEMDGTGRVLYYARDIWPNFISCALVVHEDLIREHPGIVADLVRGIAMSGAWAETHRLEAAELVAPYFRQDKKVLNYVLTSVPSRVSYVNLTPSDADLMQIEDMAFAAGIIKRKGLIPEIIDRSYIPRVISPFRITVPTTR